MNRFSFYIIFSFLLSSRVFGISGIDLNHGESFTVNETVGAAVYSGSLEDSFESLVSRPEAFKPVTKNMDDWFDVSRPAYWIKVHILGNESKERWIIKERFQTNIWDHVNVFSTCEGSKVQHSGLMVAVKNRAIKNGILMFSVPDCLHAQDLYIQMFSLHSQNISKDEFIVEKEKAANNQLAQHYYIQGIYLGIVAIMAIYNFFLFLSLKDKSYIYYVLFIASFALLWSSFFGISSEFFWPQSTEWNVTSTFYLTALSAMFGTLFVISYLNTPKNLPIINKILVFNCVLYVVCSISGWFHFWGFAQNLLAIVSLVSVSFFLIAALQLMLKGYRPAYYLFFAWFLLIIGIFMYSLVFLKVLPYNFFAVYGVEIGSVFDVALLSFGLADRINIINREKDEIKSAAIENEHRLMLLKARNDVMEMDLEMAREIQESMITRVPFPHISTLFLPMEKIGGDFYDLVALDEYRTGIFFADVSGHGVPAALITAMLKSVISNEVEARKTTGKTSWLDDTEAFMIHLNRIFPMDIFRRFLSAIYGIYDTRQKLFTWSSAAHPPMMIFHGNAADELSEMSFVNMSPQGPPVGVIDSDKIKPGVYASKTISLKNGDRILMYSDGLMDEVDYTYENQNLGMQSFKNNSLYPLLQNFSKLNIYECMDALENFLSTLHSSSDQTDDICAVLIDAG
ncbi:MAG: SpoIIE family protein phosphatase [Spirochaetia bacterium]|nr:SpoIIE family protein phosphatase [Spirochaetia bacterium]